MPVKNLLQENEEETEKQLPRKEDLAKRQEREGRALLETTLKVEKDRE